MPADDITGDVIPVSLFRDCSLSSPESYPCAALPPPPSPLWLLPLASPAGLSPEALRLCLPDELGLALAGDRLGWVCEGECNCCGDSGIPTCVPAVGAVGERGDRLMDCEREWRPLRAGPLLPLPLPPLRSALCREAVSVGGLPPTPPASFSPPLRACASSCWCSAAPKRLLVPAAPPLLCSPLDSLFSNFSKTLFHISTMV